MTPTEINPEFFHIPNFSTLAISKDAKVLDLVRNVELEEVIRYDGYRRVKTIGHGELHLHRLLALTFLETKGNTDELYVNHKDGQKLNLELSNLEWTTPSENSIHAYRTGLRKDNREVDSLDLINGEQVSFYSLNECARHFKVNPEKVHRYLHGKRNFAFELKFTLKFKTEDWGDTTKIAPYAILPGRPRPIIAEEIEGSRKILFESTATAAKVLDLLASSISYALNSKEESIFSGWRFTYLDCYEGNDTAELEFINGLPKASPQTPVRKPVPIKVTNTEDGSVTNWPSTELFGKSVGVKKNTIQKAVLVNGGRWRHFLVEYLE